MNSDAVDRTAGRAALCVLVVALVLATSCTYVLANHETSIDCTITGRDDFDAAIVSITMDELYGSGICNLDSVDLEVDGVVLKGGIVSDTYSVIPIGHPYVFVNTNTGEVTVGVQYLDNDWAVGTHVKITRTGASGVGDVCVNTVSGEIEREDCDSDEQYANYRMVTCGDIAPGKLYRAASPVNAGHGDRSRYVSELMERDGIENLMCLNLSEGYMESEHDEGTLNAYVDSLYVNGDVLCRNLPVFMFTDETFGDVFRFIAENDGPFLVTCTMGKDRTGFVVTLLEMLMGATYEEMRDDFGQSYCGYYNLEKESAEYRYVIDTRLDPVLVGIHELDRISDYTSIDWDNSDFSGYDFKADAEHMLKTVYGLTDSEIQSIRDHLSA